MVSEDTPAMEDDEAGYSAERDEDSEATLAQQNRMLQADLADKNRYIATLEKRLLQARRTSHSRASMNYASRISAIATEPTGMESIIREKDLELDELRARLDDQTRMVNALRGAARKRDTLENGRRSLASPDAIAEVAEPERPSTASSAPQVLQPATDYRSQLSSRASDRQGKRHMANVNSISHRSNPSTTSQGSTSQNYSKPLSPVSLLTNGHAADRPMSPHTRSGSSTGGVATEALKGAPLSSSRRRRSVDEMTALLDQMIADKVESGQVIRSERGTLRVKRDTVMEKPVETIDEVENEVAVAGAEAGAE
jgi:centromeric protein E